MDEELGLRFSCRHARQLVLRQGTLVLCVNSQRKMDLEDGISTLVTENPFLL